MCVHWLHPATRPPPAASCLGKPTGTLAVLLSLPPLCVLPTAAPYCSLNPGVDRLAFSVVWDMDQEANIL